MSKEPFYRAYFYGCLGGVLSALVLAALYKWHMDWMWPVFAPAIDDFYAPAVLGGLCALLYLAPPYWPWWVKVPLLSLFAGLLHMAHKFGWLYAQWPHEWSWSGQILRPEGLMHLFVFLLMWGGLTGWRLRRL